MAYLWMFTLWRSWRSFLIYLFYLLRVSFFFSFFVLFTMGDEKKNKQTKRRKLFVQERQLRSSCVCCLFFTPAILRFKRNATPPIIRFTSACNNGSQKKKRNSCFSLSFSLLLVFKIDYFIPILFDTENIRANGTWKTEKKFMGMR